MKQAWVAQPDSITEEKANSSARSWLLCSIHGLPVSLPSLRIKSFGQGLGGFLILHIDEAVQGVCLAIKANSLQNEKDYAYRREKEVERCVFVAISLNSIAYFKGP